MTEKRFTETISTGIVTDNKTGIEYPCEMRIDDDFLNLVNTIAKENEQLRHDATILIQSNQDYRKENEQLKSTMKEVCELLEEEVDLFSDKATEHDINAYIELKELDNKDAYYMATATKKAIRMLKELRE